MELIYLATGSVILTCAGVMVGAFIWGFVVEMCKK